MLSLRAVFAPVRLSIALDCLSIPSDSFASSAEKLNGLGRELKAKAGSKPVAGIPKPAQGSLLGGDSSGVHTIASLGNSGRGMVV